MEPSVKVRPYINSVIFRILFKVCYGVPHGRNVSTKYDAISLILPESTSLRKVRWGCVPASHRCVGARCGRCCCSLRLAGSLAGSLAGCSAVAR